MRDVPVVGLMGKARLLSLKLLMRAAKARTGLSSEDLVELLVCLDDAGFVMMPIDPTGQLLDASLLAMRQSRRVLPFNREAAQKVKHEIRYRAMVEYQRQRLGLTDPDPGRVDQFAVAKAIADTKGTRRRS